MIYVRCGSGAAPQRRAKADQGFRESPGGGGILPADPAMTPALDTAWA